jgi:hypothetical protein
MSFCVAVFCAVWAISARGVPAPVSNQLFYPISRWRLSHGPCWPADLPKIKPHFFSMTSCINFSGCAARCVPRALLHLQLLLPDLPLRSPAFSPLTHSLAFPSSSAALLPRPSVSLLFFFRTSVCIHCLSLRCRLPKSSSVSWEAFGGAQVRTYAK